MQNYHGVILSSQKKQLDKVFKFKNLENKLFSVRIFNCDKNIEKYTLISCENFGIYKENQKITHLKYISGESKAFFGKVDCQVIESESTIKQLELMSQLRQKEDLDKKLEKKLGKKQNKIEKYLQKKVKVEEFQIQQKDSKMKLEEIQTKQEHVQKKQEENLSKCESLIKQEEIQNKQILNQFIESEEGQNSIETKFQESSQLTEYYNQKKGFQNLQEESQNKIEELQTNQEPINGQAQPIAVQISPNNKEQRRKYVIVIKHRQ